MSNITDNNKLNNIRVPWHSKNHPMIPKLYVQPWKQDIENRKIICHNAKNGGIANYEHDDNLYLNNREQIVYNVESKERVDGKYKLPERDAMMKSMMHETRKRYDSHMLARFSSRDLIE